MQNTVNFPTFLFVSSASFFYTLYITNILYTIYKKKNNGYYSVTVLIFRKKQIELHLSRTINSFMKNLPPKLFFYITTFIVHSFVKGKSIYKLDKHSQGEGQKLEN